MSKLERELQLGKYLIKKSKDFGLDAEGFADLILELYCESDHITSKDLKTAISEYYDIPIDTITSNSRSQPLVFARFAFCLIAKKYTNLTHKQIAHQIGRTDHTTICHAMKTGKHMLETDIKFKKQVGDLTRILINQDAEK